MKSQQYIPKTSKKQVFWFDQKFGAKFNSTQQLINLDQTKKKRSALTLLSLINAIRNHCFSSRCCSYPSHCGYNHPQEKRSNKRHFLKDLLQCYWGRCNFWRTIRKKSNHLLVCLLFFVKKSVSHLSFQTSDYIASGKPLRFIENFLRDNVSIYYANTHTSTRFHFSFSKKNPHLLK